MNTDPLQHGAQLHAEGRLDEAEAVYRALLDGPPQQAATARHLLGLLLTDRGDQPGALAHYDQAIALGAASADLFFRRGELQRALGRPADAVESYDRAIALGADAEAHHARGVALASLGRLKEALESYDRALTLRPTAKNYWNNRSVVLEALGRFEEAILSCRQAITLDPHYVQAHHNAGSALLKAGLHGPAVASFDEALTRNPNIPEAWNFRAVALASQSLYEAAEESAARALALRPDYPEAHNNRSIALRALKQPQAALAAAEAALAVRPDFSEALNSKGSALVKLNRFDDACDAYRSALRLKPSDAAVHLNLGMALEALGALDEALEAFAEAERLAPDLPDARFASGLAHIRAGDVRAGFRLYETRWSQRGGPQRVHPTETLWLGETPLGDRTLLIHSEQGFGDVIQFSRFAPDAGPPSHVILQVQPALTRLLSTLDGVGAVIGTSDPAPPFDVHIPVMSLPLALGLEADQLAPRTPYLHASTMLVEDWRRRLPAAAGTEGRPSHGPAIPATTTTITAPCRSGRCSRCWRRRAQFRQLAHGLPP